MHIVDGLFVSPKFSTKVWISETATARVDEFLDDDRTTARKFVDKVAYYAEGGFGKFEGNGHNRPIRKEGDGVYRVAYVRLSLFRLIGFYEGPKKDAFIVIDAFMKSGQRLRRHNKDVIREVARVRKKHDWRRRNA